METVSLPKRSVASREQQPRVSAVTRILSLLGWATFILHPVVRVLYVSS